MAREGTDAGTGPRALWRARLRLGDHEVPVRLYAALAPQRQVRFRLLHASDGVPLTQRMVDPSRGHAVPAAAQRRGAPLPDGGFVLLAPEELAALAPPSSRAIVPLAFVPLGAVPLALFERPYRLGPDGAPGAFAALVRALDEAERVGIVRFTLRGKAHAGALLVEEGALALVTLRGPDRVRLPTATAAPAGRPFAPEERRLATELVEALAGPFVADDFRDVYADRVRALLAARSEGGRLPPAPRPRRSASRPSLVAALGESLRRARSAGLPPTARGAATRRSARRSPGRQGARRVG